MAAAAPAPRESRIRRAAAAGVVAVAAAAIAASVAWMLKPASVPSLSLARFTIPVPTGERFSSTNRHVVALSPDGGRIVYVANGRLYVRAIDQLEAVPLRGTEGTG